MKRIFLCLCISVLCSLGAVNQRNQIIVSEQKAFDTDEKLVIKELLSEHDLAELELLIGSTPAYAADISSEPTNGLSIILEDLYNALVAMVTSQADDN